MKMPPTISHSRFNDVIASTIQSSACTTTKKSLLSMSHSRKCYIWELVPLKRALFWTWPSHKFFTDIINPQIILVVSKMKLALQENWDWDWLGFGRFSPVKKEWYWKAERRKMGLRTLSTWKSWEQQSKDTSLACQKNIGWQEYQWLVLLLSRRASLSCALSSRFNFAICACTWNQ